MRSAFGIEHPEVISKLNPEQVGRLRMMAGWGGPGGVSRWQRRGRPVQRRAEDLINRMNTKSRREKAPNWQTKRSNALRGSYNRQTRRKWATYNARVQAGDKATPPTRPHPGPAKLASKMIRNM